MDFSTQANHLNLNNPKEFSKFIWVFFKSNFDLIIFPLLGWISLVGITYFYFFAELGPFLNVPGQERIHVVILYALTYYFLMLFTITYFNSMLISVTLARLNSQSRSILAGIILATCRMVYLFGWVLLSSTIGLVVRILEGIVYTLGEVIGRTIDLNWIVQSDFVVPFIMVKGVGPFTAVNLSKQLARHDIPKIKSFRGNFVMIWIFFAMALAAGNQMRGFLSDDESQKVFLKYFIYTSFLFLLTFDRAIDAITKCALFINLTESYPDNKSVIKK